MPLGRIRETRVHCTVKALEIWHPEYLCSRPVDVPGGLAWPALRAYAERAAVLIQRAQEKQHVQEGASLVQHCPTEKVQSPVYDPVEACSCKRRQDRKYRM